MPSTISPYEAMQMAVDIVGKSEHRKNKVAACLFIGAEAVARTNHWPQAIKENFDTDQRFGNSSGTMHAETGCIVDAHFATEGASICITDPFCPNCAKNIAESGIKTIYVDHKGFQKEFFVRREHEFKNMSMRIIERAGINVYEIRRKERKLIPVLEIADSYTPREDNPIEKDVISVAGLDVFYKCLNAKSEKHAGRKLAFCLAEDNQGKFFSLTARSHAAVGYRLSDDREDLYNTDGKYTFKLEPLNRLLMNAPRMGLKILKDYVYCSQIPTSREQINFIGYGLKQIYIGNPKKSRDNTSIDAADILMSKGVIQFLAL